MANKRTYTASQTLDPVPEFSKTVMNHIYYVADNMIGKSNLVEDDRCDIIQELSLAAWRALSTYRENDKAAIDTYVCRAVDNAAKNIFRIRMRKHLDEPCLSLEELTSNEAREILLPVVDDRETIELRIDVRTVVESLPEELRVICQLIMDGYSFKEIAKITGVPEPTIRIWRMKEIRERFVQSGIDFESRMS